MIYGLLGKVLDQIFVASNLNQSRGIDCYLKIMFVIDNNIYMSYDFLLTSISLFYFIKQIKAK